MTVFGRSDVGMLRHENEDAFGECALMGGAHLAIVCDGMGGESGGKEAAEACVSAFISAFDGKEIPDEETLEEAFFTTNVEVLASAAKKGYDRTGTTVVLAVASHDSLTLLWAGDSRAYLLRGSALTRLTRDHSYVQELVDAGRIREEDARTHESRHFVTRAVGADMWVTPDMCTLAWQKGDRLLLCSDGLTAMVEEKEIAEILQEEYPSARIVHELVCAANSHGGEDNITVLLLENTEGEFNDA